MIWATFQQMKHFKNSKRKSKFSSKDTIILKLKSKTRQCKLISWIPQSRLSKRNYNKTTLKSPGSRLKSISFWVRRTRTKRLFKCFRMISQSLRTKTMEKQKLSVKSKQESRSWEIKLRRAKSKTQRWRWNSPLSKKNSKSSRKPLFRISTTHLPSYLLFKVCFNLQMFREENPLSKTTRVTHHPSIDQVTPAVLI